MSTNNRQIGMGLAALLLAASSLLSRLMGLVRDKVISWQFGAGQEADMYFAAFVVPDCINYLLAGGFMSITIMPILARLRQEDEESAWRLFSCVFSWMSLVSVLLTCVCMLTAEELTQIVAPGFSTEQKLRLAFYMRIILPAQVFFLCGACFTALLFLRRQFKIPALTPLIYNGTIILGGLSAPFLLSQLNADLPFELALSRLGMTGYCAGVTLGAFLGAFLLPFLSVRSGGLKLSVTFHHPLFKKFLLTALPLMLGQTVIMLDEQFLRIFGSLLEEGSVSLLNYARRIAQVPVGLVGQAAAVASYPFLVSLLARGEVKACHETVQRALRSGLCLIIPCVAFLMASAQSVLTLIFHGGRFGLAETLAAVPLLEIMLLSVPFTMLYMVLVRAFYAHEDTITPTVTGTIVTLIALPVYYFLSARLSAEAVALTSTVSISLYVLWLFAIWVKRYGNTAGHGLPSLAVKLICISAPAALAAYFLIQFLEKICSLSPVLLSFLQIALAGLLFLLLFVPPAYVWISEARELLQKSLSRFLKRGA